MEPRQQPVLPRPVARILFQACPRETQAELLSRLPFREGATLSGELLQTAIQVVKAFTPSIEIQVSQGGSRKEFLALPPEIQRRVKPPACDDGVNVTIFDPESRPKRIHIEGSFQESHLIGKVAPLHPPGAGVVHLSVVVGKDGSVIQVDPLDGPQQLIGPVVDAVKQWKYRPTLLNGHPVEVLTNVEVET
jgi:hypothetical protein